MVVFFLELMVISLKTMQLSLHLISQNNFRSTDTETRNNSISSIENRKLEISLLFYCRAQFKSHEEAY